MVDLETNPLYYAAIGGIILGIATSLHYVLKGKVTGMSGIIYDTVFLNMDQLPDKLIIIGGIILAGGIFFDIFGYSTYNKFTPFGPKHEISSYTSFIGFALAGLMVGFGTKLSNGCTSGHGLCGLPRLSIRSFVAVGIFLSTAIGIATIQYYFTLGPFSERFSPYIGYNHLISANICIALAAVFMIVSFIIKWFYKDTHESIGTILRDNIISLFVGLIFGIGLIISGMSRRINILQFLWMCKIWNPSLLFVLGCGVIVNFIVFNYMIYVQKAPLFGKTLFNPDNKTIDWKLVLGAFCFGVGWGIGGICPGPALVLLPVFQVQIHVVWFIAMIMGMFIANRVIKLTVKSQVSSKIKDDSTKMLQRDQLRIQEQQKKELTPTSYKIQQISNMNTKRQNQQLIGFSLQNPNSHEMSHVISFDQFSQYGRR